MNVLHGAVTLAWSNQGIVILLVAHPADATHLISARWASNNRNSVVTLSKRILLTVNFVLSPEFLDFELNAPKFNNVPPLNLVVLRESTGVQITSFVPPHFRLRVTSQSLSC